MSWECGWCPQKMQVGVGKVMRWGSDGVKRPSSHQEPTHEYLLYLQHTHIPGCCLPHTHKQYSVYVCVCGCSGDGWRGKHGLCPLQAVKKNYLFNTVREHLTLNLCETVPDRNTMENRGTETKSSAERRRRRETERWEREERGGDKGGEERERGGSVLAGPEESCGADWDMKGLLAPNDCAAW